jgi:hypothetical protein
MSVQIPEERQDLTRKQAAVVEALLDPANDSMRAVAQKACVNGTSVYEIRQKPNVQRALQAELDRRSKIGSTAERIVRQALRKLEGYLNGRPDGVELTRAEFEALGALCKLSNDIRKTEAEIGSDSSEEIPREERLRAGAQIARGVLVGVLVVTARPEIAGELTAKLQTILERAGVPLPFRERCTRDQTLSEAQAPEALTSPQGEAIDAEVITGQ